MQKQMEIAGTEVWAVSGDGRPEVSRRRRGENEVTAWLRAQAAELYDIGIQNFVPRLNKCLDKGGDYVGKQLKVWVKGVFH
jgi:hypothetical protein